MFSQDNSQQLTMSNSFARVVEKSHCPTKEQAIIIDAIDGHQINEYTLALGKQIGPANILYASRISNGRICYYLNSKELVDKLVENKTKIIIGNTSLEIRSLVSKAKRIIISNVCPIIPNSIISEELKRLGVSPVSHVTTLRAGMKERGYTHILSFRRQVFINPEDSQKVPPNLQINHDGTNYWIYFSDDKLNCYKCKEDGHLAR